MTDYSSLDETLWLTLISERLKRGLPVTLTVSSLSMAPLLQVGDRVSVMPVSPELLHCGEIVLLRARPQPILHRIIAVDNQNSSVRFLTKGDNTRRADGYSDGTRILGHAIRIHRASRSVDLYCGRARRLQGVMTRLSRLLNDHPFLAEIQPVIRAAQRSVALLSWSLGA